MSLTFSHKQVFSSRWYATCLVGLGLFSACTPEDTGVLCQTPNTYFVEDPISGESPLVEVVNLTRDPNCTQFTCLTAQGLPSYCTRDCSYDAPPSHPTECTEDTDCKLPKHCFEGICNEDDCPAGFFCQIPEATGSLSNTQVCMRQTGCLTNADCSDISSTACIKVGCYDACSVNTSCTIHQKICAPITELHCSCNNGEATCDDSALVCQPDGASAALAAGTVAQIGVCLPK